MKLELIEVKTRPFTRGSQENHSRIRLYPTPDDYEFKPSSFKTSVFLTEWSFCQISSRRLTFVLDACNMSSFFNIIFSLLTNKVSPSSKWFSGVFFCVLFPTWEECRFAILFQICFQIFRFRLNFDWPIFRLRFFE